MKRFMSISKYLNRSLTQIVSDPFFLALTINLFILRIIIPFLEYLFIPMACILINNSGYRYFHTIKKAEFIIKFSKTYFVFILVCFMFIMAAIFTSNPTTLTIRETFTVLFFIAILYILSYQITTIDGFLKFQQQFFTQILVFSIISGVLGLIKFLFHVYGIEFSFLEQTGSYPIGTSLKLDHNFYSLGLIFGLILLAKGHVESKSYRKRIGYEILMFLLSATVFLSHSRRGFIALMIYIIILVFIPLFKRSSYKNRRLWYVPFVYLFLISILFSSSYHFLIGTDSISRKKVVRAMSLHEGVVKSESASFLYDYSTLIFRNIEFKKIYSDLWHADFNPLHPDYGWGYGKYQLSYPLTGPGSGMIPAGALGYKLNSNSSFIENNNSAASFTSFGTIKVN